ncbi:MAG: hypothetical protein GOV15_01820, partial [Candidatus Diapherotrites archaeon]|nr:hypothetical protein [Candidatus Diapherotrites archaeon]
PILNSAYLSEDIGLPIFKLLKKSVKENSPLYILIHKNSEAKPVFDIIKHAQQEVDEALQSLKDDALIDREAKWVYLKIKPKLNIKRKVVGLLRDAFPGYTTSVGSEKDHFISVSNRSVIPILNDVIPKSVEGFGKGGGHAKASGCGFQKEHESEWIKNMKRLLKEYN